MFKVCFQEGEMMDKPRTIADLWNRYYGEDTKGYSILLTQVEELINERIKELEKEMNEIKKQDIISDAEYFYLSKLKGAIDELKKLRGR